MTLLCLLLINNFKNIVILRHNQQDNNYDIIDIDLLAENLYKYISNKTTNNLDKVNIIYDIVFVLTIFGNDFLPKIEAFNVKYDFDKIIDRYMMLLKDKNEYLINIKNKTINQLIFTQLIKILHYDEGGNLQQIYISTHYQNYDKLKQLFKTTSDNFIKKITLFLNKLRKFNNDIKNNKIDVSKWNTDNEFIDLLMKLTKFQQLDNKLSFINDYVDYYKASNKFPEVRVTFRKYARSLRNAYHHDKLEKTLNYLDNKLKITKYDEEIYKLDNMLDEYAKKLNATSLNLGYVYIDPVSYVWKTEKIEKSVKKYYSDFFGINDMNIKNDKMANLINNYITGLMWVFDYYFNDNITYSIWYYPFTHAPLLTQIYYFMTTTDEDYLNKISISKYNVQKNEIFTPIQHLIYVSPVKSYPDIIPNNIKQKVMNSDFVIDTKKIVNKIFKDDTSNEIDCRGILFLNKCHVNSIHIDKDIITSWNEDKKFMQLFN